MTNKLNKCVFFIVTQKLQNCLANCSLSCKETVYSGSISFAQLSSQATNALLNVHSDEFTSRFQNAVDLANRLSYTTMANAANYWYNFTAMADAYYNSLEKFYSTSSQQIRKAFQLFSTSVVKHDLDLLNDELTQFVNFYNTKYKFIRNVAAKYTQESIDCIGGVYMAMIESPESFENISDAQWYSIRLSATVASCASSALVAVKNLQGAVSKELDNQYQFAPQNFYVNQSVASFCSDLYTDAIAILTAYCKQLHYISTTLSQWLSKTTADNTLQFCGLWSMFNCTECNSSVNYNLIKTYFTSGQQNAHVDMGDQVSQCLSGYEQILNIALLSVKQGVADVPIFQQSAYSVNSTSYWLYVNDNVLKAAISDMLTGTNSFMNSTNILMGIVSDLMFSMFITDNEYMLSLKAWMLDITQWQSNITAIYASITDTIVSLSEISLNNSVRFHAVINNVRMFQEPILNFGSNAEITFGFPNNHQTIFNDPTLFLASADNQISGSVNRNLKNGSALIEMSVGALRASYNDLVAMQTTLNSFSQSYLTNYNIDNTFVG